MEDEITKTDTDKNEVKGSQFSYLRLKAIKSTNSSVTIKWTKFNGAKGYFIYGAKCGKNYKMLKTVSAKTLKYTFKKLKKATYYKYMVVAFKVVKGKKDVAAISKTVHQTTTGGKKGNAIKMTINKTKITLKKGKTFTLKGKVKWNKKKYEEHVKTVRFESNKKNIAKVNKNGVITAKKKGSCYVYAYAQNGTYQRIKVTVK